MSVEQNQEADTVIKLFEDYSCPKEHESQLKEMLQFLAETQNQGMVLHLRENISGNVFNRPFQYINIREITDYEKLPENLKNDGDPMSDFFVTLRKLKSKRNGQTSAQLLHDVYTIDEDRFQKRFIILAFKVLDDDKTSILDKTWKYWTGACDLLMKLSAAPEYEVSGVSCFKGVNLVPDIFKYFVLIEINMKKNHNDTLLMDCMQKFRIRRMSGYAALYTMYNAKDIKKILEYNENEIEEIMC